MAPNGSTTTWRPEFKDIYNRHVLEGHFGPENSPVATLIQNNAILPPDQQMYGKQNSKVLVLLTSQSRDNVSNLIFFRQNCKKGNLLSLLYLYVFFILVFHHNFVKTTSSSRNPNLKPSILYVLYSRSSYF